MIFGNLEDWHRPYRHTLGTVPDGSPLCRRMRSDRHALAMIQELSLTKMTKQIHAFPQPAEVKPRLTDIN